MFVYVCIVEWFVHVCSCLFSNQEVLIIFEVMATTLAHMQEVITHLQHQLFCLQVPGVTELQPDPSLQPRPMGHHGTNIIEAVKARY